ncbi:hypothetical protein [Streptomyces fradiae]|uniref:hypothetical protein n=1 Tax=Streptomyces fradiae TaxID=1906 RepID=UPI0039871911
MSSKVELNARTPPTSPALRDASAQVSGWDIDRIYAASGPKSRGPACSRAAALIGVIINGWRHPAPAPLASASVDGAATFDLGSPDLRSFELDNTAVADGG